jgi:hypothetical protein
MAEHDVFELRLGRALNRYVADLAVEIDATGLTESIAAAHGRRWLIGAWRLHAPGLPWTPRAVQVAWLVLLAGLLAVMAIGLALVAGSQRPALGFACPPGSTPDEPGPADQARPVQPSAIAFDRRAGRLVALARSDWNDYIVETWTFDVCANTWTRMNPDHEPPGLWPPGGAPGQLVFDVDSDVTILVASGKVWVYDFQANTWTEQGVAPTGATLCAFDPLSGRVVAASDADPIELWNYDVETDTWAPIRQTNRLGPLGYGAYAYDASADRIIGFTRGVPDETRLLDIRTGTWSSGAEPPDLRSGLWTRDLPVIAYDEAAERTVFGSAARLAAYDATADRWEVLIEADFPDSVPLLRVYDPVNRRLVGWGQGGGGIMDGAVVAFDLQTRQWTVLLEWSEGQPRPLPGATQRPVDLIEGDPHEEP